MVDTATLSPEKQAEFENDKRESNRRYDAAFDEVLSHTTEAEWSTFWVAFGAENHETPWIRAALQLQNNPMHENTARVSLQPAPHTNDAAAAVQHGSDDSATNEEHAVI